jgi:hypothetical protein
MSDRDYYRRLVRGLDVDQRAVALAVDDVVAEPYDSSVDRRIDVGPGSCPDVQGARRRAVAAAQLVVRNPASAAAEDAVEGAREEPLIGLAAERIDGKRVVAGAVVADRGHVLLVDRQLDVQRTVGGDHQRARRAGGEQARRARGHADADDRTRPGTERGNGEHHQDGEPND